MRVCVTRVTGFLLKETDMQNFLLLKALYSSQPWIILVSLRVFLGGSSRGLGVGLCGSSCGLLPKWCIVMSRILSLSNFEKLTNTIIFDIPKIHFRL